jgi:hypothetical protein
MKRKAARGGKTTMSSRAAFALSFLCPSLYPPFNSIQPALMGSSNSGDGRNDQCCRLSLLLYAHPFSLFTIFHSPRIPFTIRKGQRSRRRRRKSADFDEQHPLYLVHVHIHSNSAADFLYWLISIATIWPFGQ